MLTQRRQPFLSSAQTAAAAAAAAAAANLPSLKHLKLGTNDLLDASTKKKKQAIIEQKLAAEEQRKLLEAPFPEKTEEWTVDDVCRWLDTIALSQYKRAFGEGAVDGSFLTELRNEDLRDILGMEHELHRKKVLVMIDKLRPLDEREIIKRDIVLQEEGSTQQRQEETKRELMPTADQVFSMCIEMVDSSASPRHWIWASQSTRLTQTEIRCSSSLHSR